jgi:hypothetical protein
MALTQMALESPLRCAAQQICKKGFSIKRAM